MNARAFLVVAALLTGCSAPAWMTEPGLPGELARSDDGTLTGSWREVRRAGRAVADGYMLTIDLRIGTFAVQKGCAATGGVLSPLGGDRFRIERYESGFAVPGCGPWRAAPELAPFDGAEVRLTRKGQRLFASGSGHDVEFMRMTFRDGQ